MDPKQETSCSAWISENGRLVETIAYDNLDAAMSAEDPFYWYHEWAMNERDAA